MAEQDATCIGRVQHVLGSTVTVALDPDLAGIAPIYRGRLQPVGQVGSLVRIPQGIVDLIATVSLVGIAELSGSLAPSDAVQIEDRWLRLELLGEIDRATGRFERGVGSYPGLDDPVHFATPEQLAAVFPPADADHLRLGCLSAAIDIPVCLDASSLVVRHSAIVGSTGSGKTSAVSSILQNLVRGGWKAANVIVIDSHGEYAHALSENASSRSVLPGGAPLRVPFWALPAAEISRIFTGSRGAPAFDKRFAELVAVARRDFAQSAAWLAVDPAEATSDMPLPFDLKAVWHAIDRENRETRTDKSDPTTARETDPGDAKALRSAEFEPYGPAGHPPHKAPEYGTYGVMPTLLRLGLRDPRLRFLQEPAADVDGPDPLVQVVHEWLGELKPISVLNFSGVSPIAAEAAIGVVLNLVFEIALRSERDGRGIGRPNPVLIVLEEAHRYLGEGASALIRESANRIAREGRKYGVGLMLVTQRPTELAKTALSQCGTIIALRLSNAEDQGAIRAALPDTVAGLAALLPSLRTGEAIASGEALVVPARTLIDAPSPAPLAEDPSLRRWRLEPKTPELSEPIAVWRGAT